MPMPRGRQLHVLLNFYVPCLHLDVRYICTEEPKIACLQEPAVVTIMSIL